MNDVPVLIVGAGMAGTALGLALAQRGLRCTVVERNVSTRPQFRGEIIQPYGTHLLARLGLLEEIRSTDSAQVRQFVSHFPRLGQGAWTTTTVDGSNGLPDHALTCRHHKLYGALREVLRNTSGVELLEGWRVAALARRAPDSWAVDVTAPGGQARQIRCGMVVGADGMRSLLHSVADFNVRTATATTWLLGAVERCDAPDEQSFRFLADKQWAAYVFPVGRHCRRVSIHMRREAVPTSHEGRERVFLRRLQQAYTAFGIDDRRTERVEGLMAVPAHRMRSTWRCRDGLCVIGDAAGTVNPITGHGLTLACHDALRLASAIAESAKSGRRDVPCADDIPAEHDPYRRAVEDFSDMLVDACFDRPDAGSYSELAAAFGAIPKLSLLLEGAPLLERFRRIQQQLSFNIGQNHLSNAQGSENASSESRRGR